MYVSHKLKATHSIHFTTDLLLAFGKNDSYIIFMRNLYPIDHQMFINFHFFTFDFFRDVVG